MTTGRIQIVDPAVQYDEELRQWLEKFIEQHSHLTTTVLSRADHIGITRSYLDAYLNRTLFLPKEEGGLGIKSSRIEDQVRAFRDKVEGTARHGLPAGFVRTRAWQVLHQACQTAITRNVIVVVYGPPGVGKTTCLQQFSINSQITPPINILCSPNVTTRDFIQQVAEALKLDSRPPTAKLERMVADKLRKSPKPLIIDQANYLSEKSLGSLCYWWDIARVATILVGTSLLYETFMRSKLTEDVRAQLSRRVAVHYPLPTLEAKEAKGILARALGDDYTDELCAEIISVTGGIFGNIDNLLSQYTDLRKRNEQALKAGDTTTVAIARTAGTKLMIA